MKKMKAKEFKEALNKVGFDMDVYGYEGILNMLIIKLDGEAEEMYARGNSYIADLTRKQSKTLYNILEARGYYDDVPA